MNKKVFAILLVIVLLFCSSLFAFAESVQHVEIGAKKISLGMSKEQVYKITGMKDVSDNNDWLFNLWSTVLDGYDREGTDLIPGNFGKMHTSFAGYDACSEIASFNSENVLTSVVIVFGGIGASSKFHVDKEGAHKMYTELKEALTKKYGDPISDNGKFIDFSVDNYDATQAINSPFFTEKNTYSSRNKYGFNSREILNTSQFLVYQGDSYVDIQLIEFNQMSYEVTFSDKIEPKYGLDGCILSYSLCPQEAVEIVIEDAQNKLDSLNSDI